MSLVSQTVKVLKEMVFFVLGLPGSFRSKKNIPVDKRNVKKILIIESGGIGDLLRVFPAIECLLANFQEAEISILVSPSAKGILSLFSPKEILSDIIDYDLKVVHKSFFKKLLLIFVLRKRRYDLMYVANRGVGMREQAVMTFLIGAPNRLGFKENEKGFLHTVEVEFKENVPILKQNLTILEAAGLDIPRSEIEIDISEKDMVEAEKFLRVHDFSDSYPLILIQPGSSWNTGFTSWRLDKYISLIKILISELKAKVIIVGDKNERESGERIIREIQSTDVISAIGKTTIGQMGALIKLSDIYIGNDSGPLHIAVALRKKSIGIFGPTSSEQVLSHHNDCIIINKKLHCSPCYKHQHNFFPNCKEKKCLDLITPDEVMAGVRKLI